ncbi:MAG TPA: hypothetical protein VHC68_00485 [Candidatus Paceibacterota bacterium]|nr:hypothetical protein [Candidatus Paceibacterota bacterium]
MIVSMIRKFYELEDGIGRISEQRLFLHALRDYYHASKGYETQAQEAYLDYCLMRRVRFEIARCLLPGKVESPK